MTSKPRNSIAALERELLETIRPGILARLDQNGEQGLSQDGLRLLIAQLLGEDPVFATTGRALVAARLADHFRKATSAFRANPQQYSLYADESDLVSAASVATFETGTGGTILRKHMRAEHIEEEQRRKDRNWQEAKAAADADRPHAQRIAGLLRSGLSYLDALAQDWRESTVPA